ncbi:MAG: methyltransferase domain-containing protein, partial [Candidatus Competibacteraceae bacterium]|nr:methyltransferase domain-containing protein [Candidatus Competibacteraceae bacterium]
MRPELELISEWIRPGTRVLDLGCGDGALLAYLHERRQVSGYGLEIDSANIVKCIRAGVNVIHADLEVGLEDFGDSNFDYVIMTQTLQAVRHTER